MRMYTSDDLIELIKKHNADRQTDRQTHMHTQTTTTATLLRMGKRAVSSTL